MIEIKFPANRPDIALALGQALTAIGTGSALVNSPAPTTAQLTTDHEHQADVEAEQAHTEAIAEAGAADVVNVVPEAAKQEITDSRVDHNGVQFNAKYCANAKDPFYGTGKKRGQWKKRKGVDDADYDGWYLGEAQKAEQPADAAEPSTDTAAAFATQEPPAAEPSTVAPVDLGTFMGWVSAKQAAQLLSQDDIDAAYAQAKLAITDLMPPTDACTVRNNLATLHSILIAKAGA